MMTESKKPKDKLPIGIENFEKIRREGFYYIDKTGMIADLLRSWGEINLFTRPRRFGKSLNMSMLKYFFETGCDKSLFDGLRISAHQKLCNEYMGKFPVISISLKGVSGHDFETARAMMSSIIGSEALRFQFLADSEKLSDEEKSLYNQLKMVDVTNRTGFIMPDGVLMGSLKTLSALLRKHYGEKVVILIDEYDVPLAKANQYGYYEQMVMLIRGVFEQALKTNDHLQFAVLTGCLRVAKESIFTGLNNLRVLSVTDIRFAEYFGFTDGEVRALLSYYDLDGHYDTIREWYAGYRFGNEDVYCPWDVICYADKLCANPQAQPEAYWSNTSGNDVVRHFIEQAQTGTIKREIEQLVAGEAVTKTIRQELTYRELYDSIDHIWSVLFTTGYLTQRGEPDGRKLSLVIPNQEIRSIFTDQIMEWFNAKVQADGASLNAFCEALKSGDAGQVEAHFTKYLSQTISIRDSFVRKPLKENFYHGILLGLLVYKADWIVSSNKEAGAGYSDIQVEIEAEEIGIIIEVKYSQSEAGMESLCQEALRQIEQNEYDKQLRDEGMKTIIKYGIACYKKKCRVVCG